MTNIQHSTIRPATSDLQTVVHATGLDHLAQRIEGDNFTVCDISTHGVAGCAEMRNAMLQQQIIAEWVAIGVCLFVAVMVGSLATAFVHLFAKALGPVRRRRERARMAAAGDHKRNAIAA